MLIKIGYSKIKAKVDPKAGSNPTIIPINGARITKIT